MVDYPLLTREKSIMRHIEVMSFLAHTLCNKPDISAVFLCTKMQVHNYRDCDPFLFE